MCLLTIAIPTFNRQTELDKYLDSITSHVLDNYSEVKILISDNASDYDVQTLVDNYNRRGFGIKTIFNKTNIGMSSNFLQLLRESTGEYIWLFSDDEFLNYNFLNRIIEILRFSDFSYIFINNSRVNRKSNDLITKIYDKDVFLRKVGIFNTLITSNIYRREHLSKSYEPNYKTLFPHLHICLSVLNDHKNYLYIKGEVFSSIYGNSGGYKWWETFVLDLNNVLNHHSRNIGKRNLQFLQNQLIIFVYFKSFLIAKTKGNNSKRNPLLNFEFEDEKKVYEMLRVNFRHRLSFWLFIFPIEVMSNTLRRMILWLFNEFIIPLYRS